MKLKFKKTVYILGESIPVEIIFENSTSAKIIIENPERSFDIIMHLFDTIKKEEMNYTMGQVESTVFNKAENQYAIVIPPKQEIEIGPKSSFAFTSNVNNRLFLYPGQFECFLTDHETKQSNSVEISIVYTKESVKYLFELSKDIHQSYGRREWAMEWLQKLYGNFKLYLSVDDDNQETIMKNEEHNKILYNEFMNWWNDNKDSIKIKGLFTE